MFRSYFDRIRRPGEEIILRLRPHWLSVLPVWIGTLLGLVGLGFAAFGGLASPWLRWTFAALAAAVLAAALVRWLWNRSLEAVISTERLVYKRGFLARHTEELGVRRISEVSLTQTLAGRLLGYGTLTVNAVGDDAIVLKEFGDPFGAKRALDQLLGRVKP